MIQTPQRRGENLPERRSLASLSLRCLLVAALALPSASFAVTKQKVDFVVGVNGDFKAAMAAAKAAGGKRFVIFFPDGEYNIGSLTGDANQMTTFATANVSMIGQSADKTVIYNKSLSEGISITATLYLNNADNLYMQDLSIKNNGTHNSGSANRHVAIMEQSDKVVYKNVKLLSTQDTYYTKGTRTYWEGGEIHGTTDFICGGSDVFFNKVRLNEAKVSAITASQSNSTWGYVFKDCTIDAVGSGYTLGRSWGDARTVFLNTKLNKLPSAAGWGDPMNSVPKVFAEYKSVNASGGMVDLSQRRKSYTKGTTTVNLNPVLSDADAAKYTVANVLGGSDNWQPQAIAKQLAAPVVTPSGNTLKWDDNTDALYWALFKGGKYLGNVTTNSYDASSLAKGDVITVRAANAMGGLGPSSAALTVGNTTSLENARATAMGLGHRYDRSTKSIRITADHPGFLWARLYALDGTLVAYRAEAAATALDLPLIARKPGLHVLKYGTEQTTWSGSIDLW